MELGEVAFLCAGSSEVGCAVPGFSEHRSGEGKRREET